MRVSAQAEAIAREAHAGQVEKLTGSPYVEHLRRVVDLVNTDEEKAVAWLHDALEDTNADVWKLERSDLPREVIDAVVILTRQAPMESYADYIARVQGSRSQLARTVKLADLRDHLRAETLDKLPRSMRQRYELALQAFSERP